MKRIIFSLLFGCALLRAFEAEAFPPPQVSDKTRLEFSEARAQRAAAQATYDALPGEIKKAFEAALQALQVANQAEQVAANQALKECGEAYRPVLDAGKLVCQLTPPAEKLEKK